VEHTDPARRWQRADVLWRRSLNTVMVMPPDSDAPIALTATGPAVWDRLSEPRTLDDLVDGLAFEFGADAEVVRHDVVALLDHLLGLGVVVMSAAEIASELQERVDDGAIVDAQHADHPNPTNEGKQGIEALAGHPLIDTGDQTGEL
jgi:Coenzyme PQQ synthesis protein D (PqqD)